MVPLLATPVNRKVMPGLNGTTFPDPFLLIKYELEIILNNFSFSGT